MIIDFSDYKFIVSSGCSYGRMSDYVFNPFKHLIKEKELYNEYGSIDWLETNNEKVISINTSMGSQSSDWQSDSIIYVLEKLFELNVKPENIYCLVEWSQWHRFSIHPFHHHNLNEELFDFERDDFFKNPNFTYEVVKPNEKYGESRKDVLFFYEFLKLYNSKKIYNIGKIEDRIYMSPQHTDRKKFEEMGVDYKLFYDYSVNLELSYPIENKIKTYLDNILRTQYFLEKYNLKYNFLFMQSTLSEWTIDNQKIIRHPLFNSNGKIYNIKNNVAEFNNEYNPINDSRTDIENIMKETKTKINQINFNNFWLYENEKYRRGGIDEWSIDNLKETGYINLTIDNLHTLTIDDVLPNYNEHPNLLSYIILWNKVTKNCGFLKVKSDFEEFMWDKYWEDYHYDGITKNTITLSKKEWNKIMGK
jgi:hypothetical protein